MTVLLPQIIVEAGFAPSVPAGAPATFILDSATQGILDTDILGNVTANWADISQYVLNFTVTRASTRQQGPLLTVQASTFSCVLDNSDGRFDPDNLGNYNEYMWTGDGVTTRPSLVATLPVTALQTYSFSALCYSPQGWATGVFWLVNWLDASNAIISAAGGSGSSVAIPAGGTGTPVTLASQLAPAGTVSAQIFLSMKGTPASSVQMFAGAGPGTLPAYLTAQPITWTAANGATVTVISPWIAGPPYVTLGVTQIRPMIPVRVTAVFAGVTYPLFSGFADSWQDANVTYSAGTAAGTGYDEVTLSATDAFKPLAGITLAPVVAVGAGESAGARVHRILNSAGWYTDHRNIDTGDTTLQATAYGDTVLNLLQLTSDSEIGELYVNGRGSVVFRHRRAVLGDTRSQVPQAVFGDLDGTVQAAGTELAFASVGRADDDTTMANDVQATNANIGTLQEVQDTNSIATFLFPRTYARTDLILQTDADANYWAQGILQVSKGGEDRFDTLAVDPQADVVNLWPQVLGREYGDRVQVWRRPPGAGTITRDVLIRGIAHTFDASTGAWLTTWTLQDAARFTGFLLLDSATSGVLDTNKLAY